MRTRLLASSGYRIMTNQNIQYCSFNQKTNIIKNTKKATVLTVGFFVALLLGVCSGVSAMEPIVSSSVDGQSFASPMPKISGTAEGAQEVLVYIDGVLNGKTQVKNSFFSYVPFVPLSSGNHEVMVQSGSEKSFPILINIIPNPSPTLLMPAQGSQVGQDRIWVGGVAKNDSLVRVLVDGVENARVKVKNNTTGTASFGAQLKDLSQGVHVVTAIARDKQGKESFISDPLVIDVKPATPAPILNKPIVNAYSGIERPIISGFAKNNLEIYFVIDGKIEYRLPLGADPSGVMSFSWQPSKAFFLGEHKIELFASDNGKLSNNSIARMWQVGEIADVSGSVSAPEPKPLDDKDEIGQAPSDIGEKQKDLSVSEGEKQNALSVKDDLQKEDELPIVPDDSDEAIGQDKDDEGRIAADDDAVLGSSKGPEDKSKELAVLDEPEGDIKEITPGAVVRNVEEKEEFTFNTSLVIGIVILAFLLLSILVWYIQEKRAELGDRVVNIFREDDENQDEFEYTTPEDSASEIKKSSHLPGEGHTDSIRPPAEKKKGEDKKLDDSSFSGDSFDMPSPPFGEPEPPAPKYEPPKEDFPPPRPDHMPPPPPPMF